MKTKQVTPQQMEVIINIQMMQNKIGIKGLDFDFLSNQTFDWLFNHQLTLIEHYNQAVRNAS